MISLKRADTYMAPIPSRKNNEQLDKFYTTLHYLSELIDESVLFYNILRAENPGSEWLGKPLIYFYMNLDNYYKGVMISIRMLYDNSRSVPAAMKSQLSDEFFLPDEITYGLTDNWNMITNHLSPMYRIDTPEGLNTILKFPNAKRDIIEKMSRLVGKIKPDEKSRNSFAYLNIIKITKYWSQIESSIKYV